MKRVAIASLIVLVTAWSVQATPIVDYFNYSGGGTIGGKGVAGNGWAGAWVGSGNNTNDTQYYLSTNVTYSDGYYAGDFADTVGSVGGGLAGYIPKRTFSTPLTGTIWLSAIVNYSGGLVFLYLDANDKTNDVVGLNSGKAVIRYNSGSDSAGKTVASGSVHLLLAKIVESPSGADAISYWVDPNLSGGEGTLGTPDRSGTGADCFGTNSLTSIGITVAGTSRLDAMRFGSTLAEVTAPEPATLVLLALGGLTVLRRRD
jgi:hypothetical protein